MTNQKRKPHRRFVKNPPNTKCSECGEVGQHFAPPSLGMPGFFTCQEPDMKMLWQDERGQWHDISRMMTFGPSVNYSGRGA